MFSLRTSHNRPPFVSPGYAVVPTADQPRLRGRHPEKCNTPTMILFYLALKSLDVRNSTSAVAWLCRYCRSLCSSGLMSAAEFYLSFKEARTVLRVVPSSKPLHPAAKPHPNQPQLSFFSPCWAPRADSSPNQSFYYSSEAFSERNDKRGRRCPPAMTAVSFSPATSFITIAVW